MGPAGFAKVIEMAQELGLRRRFRAILVLCCGPIKAWGGGPSAWGNAGGNAPRGASAGPAAARPALAGIIDLGHALVRLARETAWGFLDRRFAGVRPAGPGQPGVPTRRVAGRFILKHMHNLSDEVLCTPGGRTRIAGSFCGESSFCRRLPFARSSLTHWRQRPGEEPLAALVHSAKTAAQPTFTNDF